MDSTAVSRGLRTIRSGFGALGSAIGRLRGAWGKLKGSAIGAVFGAIAQQVQNTAKWMVVLRDEMAATGQSAKDILQIREALELTGVDPGRASEMVNEMQKRLAEAAEPGGGGEAGKGLDLLGLNVRDLFAMPGAAAFKQIMSAVKASDKDIKFLVKALDSLFGGEGMKMIALARNYEATMKSARENTEGLAEAFTKKGAAGITEMQARMSKFRNAMRTFWLELMDKLPLEALAKMIAAIADKAPKIIEGITKFFENPMGEGSFLKKITDWFDDLIKRLMGFIYEMGEHLKQFAGPLVKALTGKELPGKYDDIIPGKDFNMPKEGVLDQKILDEQKMQNNHLRDLARRKAVWA